MRRPRIRTWRQMASLRTQSKRRRQASWRNCPHSWLQPRARVAVVPGRSPACSRYGTPLHMDGARLLEIAPWYGRDPAEIAALFDSVHLSLY